MSSIPVRRTTRTTRSMKDSENVARPTRATSRAKTALGATASQATSITTRATAATAASKAKTIATETENNVGKRKREALVEVTVGVNKTRVKPTGTKGKEKAKEATVDEAPVIGKVAATTNTKGPRRAGSVATRPTVRATRSTTTSTAGAGEVGEAKVFKKEHTTAASNDITKAKPFSRTITRVYRDDEGELETMRVFKKQHRDVAPEDLQVAGNSDSQAEAEKIANELIAVDSEPEAKEDLKVQLWDDLDAEDWDDPLMVSEYVIDVCKYWKELELATLPKADYMIHQSEINWDHRAILVDWILQVHARFNLLPESLFLSVNLIDRFLSARPISLSKLQLVGLTCFFVATKFEETCAPSVNEIVFLSDDQYTVDEVLKAEMYILKILNWDLRCPGPMSWLRRGSKADDCESQARTVAKYLLEIGCLERRLIGVIPSLIAAAALWLGRLTIGREEWTPNLEHYTTFSEENILPIATIMLEYVLTEPIQHESLYKKYAHKKYMKCSVYMRHWALERWSENDEVYLANHLKHVKDEIRKQQSELAEKAERDANDSPY